MIGFIFFNLQLYALVRDISRDFPGGTVGKNRLPMQGTLVRSLAWEYSICCGATKPFELQLLKPARLQLVLHSKRRPSSLQLEKALKQQRRATTIKTK